VSFFAKKKVSDIDSILVSGAVFCKNIPNGGSILLSKYSKLIKFFKILYTDSAL
jgi:hypothetical protein